MAKGSDKLSPETVVEDIHKLLQEVIEGRTIDIPEEYINQFKENVASAIVRQLTPRTSDRKEKVLYFSEVGKPCARALWYDHNECEKEALHPDNLTKFMYGDILEEFLILLVKLSGHKVTDEQKQVQLPLHDGWVLRGRIDFKIDDVLVDAKSASSFAFKKFSEGKLVENDPFGYMAQLACYTEAEGSEGSPGFLVIDKQHGKIVLHQPSKRDLENAVPCGQMLVSVIEAPEPPDRLYLDQPYGKSGNRTLGIECSFCNKKKECWKDANNGKGLRSFKYSDGRVIHLTDITREPRIEEL